MSAAGSDKALLLRTDLALLLPGWKGATSCLSLILAGALCHWAGDEPLHSPAHLGQGLPLWRLGYPLLQAQEGLLGKWVGAVLPQWDGRRLRTAPLTHRVRSEEDRARRAGWPRCR